MSEREMTREEKRTQVLQDLLGDPETWERATQAIRCFLSLLGDDPDREGLKETPERVLHTWLTELCCGYKQDPETVLKTFKEDTSSEMVVIRNVEFYSTCEHHLLPFHGTATIAYIPNGKVVGISKLVRLLEIYSRRLQIQERICQQITSSLMKHLEPLGAACILQARHMCMSARGVNKQTSEMVTSSLEGVFLDNSMARAELMNFVNH